MMLSQEILIQLRPLNLLSHPFYQAWTEGKLSIAQLRNYAEQYKPFVDAFPRFVSALHSQCEDEVARQEILENLMDEEGKTNRSAPHPQLWKNFMKALGTKNEPIHFGDAAVRAKETYLEICRSSYEEGLCALYAYEYQTPEISKTKIDGLKRFYNIVDTGALEFFRVHETADVYHSKTCEGLIDQIPLSRHSRCLDAAKRAGTVLWDLLSEAYEHPQIN